jgi:tRNA(fMet)-specific endonuclease VapC
VGTLLDSTVLIRWERTGSPVSLPDDEEVAIAAITASELLHGVHRADTQHRATREAFVEHVLRVLPTLPFDLAAARVHSRLWAELVSAGQMIGPHDLIIAAIAVARGWSVATLNREEFARVAGLRIIGP